MLLEGIENAVHDQPRPSALPPAAPLDDPLLPALRYLASPAGATQLLREEWQRGGWPRPLPLPIVRAVRMLRYHPGRRCTLWLTLDDWPVGNCIVKVYARRETALATADVVSALGSAGFAPATPYRVPALLASIPDRCLLLLDVVPGVPVKKLVSAGEPASVTHAVEWLAAFSAARLPFPTAYTLHHPLTAASRWSVRLRRQAEQVAPALAADAAHLLDALAARCPSWPPRVHLIHGDFGMVHVFVTPDATSVVDWDSCRPGHPAEDAGRFLVSLYDLAARHPGKAAPIMDAVACFQAAYAALLPTVASSLPFYTARACLRRACRTLDAAGIGPQRIELAAHILSTGRALLAADGSTAHFPSSDKRRPVLR